MTDSNPSKMQLTPPYDTPVCKHGRPASVCETCEIERLRAELEAVTTWYGLENEAARKRGTRTADETTALPMTGFMHDTLHNRIVPDPDYRTAFKVGDRILSDKSLYRWWPTATVTEITAKGFKYRHDQPIQLGPRYGWYQEGESFTDDGWGLAKDQTPCTTDKTTQERT